MRSALLMHALLLLLAGCLSSGGGAGGGDEDSRDPGPQAGSGSPGLPGEPCTSDDTCMQPYICRIEGDGSEGLCDMSCGDRSFFLCECDSYDDEVLCAESLEDASRISRCPLSACEFLADR